LVGFNNLKSLCHHSLTEGGRHKRQLPSIDGKDAGRLLP
jgi:ribosomal protein S30